MTYSSLDFPCTCALAKQDYLLNISQELCGSCLSMNFWWTMGLKYWAPRSSVSSQIDCSLLASSYSKKHSGASPELPSSRVGSSFPKLDMILSTNKCVEYDWTTIQLPGYDADTLNRSCHEVTKSPMWILKADV